MQEHEQLSSYEKIKRYYDESLVILKELKEEKGENLSPQTQNEE